jgi:hypothetical protein
VIAPIVGTLMVQFVGISAPFIFGGCIVLLVSWATFRHIQVAPVTAESAA